MTWKHITVYKDGTIVIHRNKSLQEIYKPGKPVEIKEKWSNNGIKLDNRLCNILPSFVDDDIYTNMETGGGDPFRGR